MDLRIFVEPQQGAHFDELLRVAQATEQLGFDAFFRSDHYLAIGEFDDGTVPGLPGPTDAWVTLAALARETSRIRLGTLVSSATFRLPGPLAIAVAQVDQMSGGRIDFGLGAGWYTREHEAYGIEFPEVEERFDRFAEQLAIITGLWETPLGETFSYAGSHYSVIDSPALPKPTNPAGPPVIIGGRGRRRTPALTAQYAAEFNAALVTAEVARDLFGRIRQACTAAGRTEPPIMSTAIVVCCGQDDAEVARRAAVIGREVEELRANGLAGTPKEVIAKIKTYADAGAERLYLQVLDLGDLEHLQLIAEEVMPAVRG